MKKHYFLLLVFCAMGLQLSAQDARTLVTQAANQQLQVSLARIPSGQEKNYGFENRSDFSRAVVGQPIRVTTIPADFFENGQQAIVPLNEWRVPVVVDGQTRILFTVYDNGTKYEVADIGGALLGRELQQKTTGADAAYIFRIYPLYVDFLVKVPANGNFENARYVAMESAVHAIDPAKLKADYSQAETFELLRELNANKNKR
jgi:hypothetical protein